MSHPLEAWREFARHADGCRECEVGAALVRRCPEAHKSAWGVCCDAGRALLEVWIAAVQELAGDLRGRALLGHLIPSAREEPYAAEERGLVLTQLPQAGILAILAAGPDAQEGMVRAAVAAHRAGGVVARERDPVTRTCANEECTRGVNGARKVFNVSSRTPNHEFCGDACRKAAQRRRPRLSLVETEE